MEWEDNEKGAIIIAKNKEGAAKNEKEGDAENEEKEEDATDLNNNTGGKLSEKNSPNLNGERNKRY